MTSDEQDPWEPDTFPDIAVGVRHPPAPAPLPPPKVVSMASLVTCVVPYRKGRLAGDFKIRVLPESDVDVTLQSVTFAGRRHTGSMRLSDRGTEVKRSSWYIRLNICDHPSDAASHAIEEAAKTLAGDWIARHPDAFDAADALAAHADMSKAVARVADLKKQLAAAEEAEKLARADAARREAALWDRGIVRTEDEGDT